MNYDQTLKQVEELYQRVTGQTAPKDTLNNKPINHEADPVQLLNFRISELLQTLQDPSIIQALQPWAPRVAIWENDDTAIFRIEVAGVKKEEIDISIMANSLVISGLRHPVMRDSGFTARHNELLNGPFKRVIPFLGNLNTSEISSNLKDGILEITIPKQNAQTKTKASKKNGSVQ